MAYLPGELLMKTGVVRPEQHAAAHRLREREGGSFGECLVRVGAINEQQLAEFYHRRLMVPRLPDGRLAAISPKLIALLPSDMAAEFRVIPVELDGEGAITLAMADPADNHAVEEVSFFLGRDVLRAVAAESPLRRAIERHYGIRFTAPIATAPSAAKPSVATPSVATPLVATPLVATRGAKRPAQDQADSGKPEARKHEPRTTSGPSGEPIVLLTEVKRSEHTPLPAPIAPPSDLEADSPEDDALGDDEPILLTRRVDPGTRTATRSSLPNPPIGALRAALGRADIDRLLLDYFGQLTGRTALFVVKAGRLTGHDARGESFDPALIRTITISLDSPSIFRDVVRARLPYRGPLPESAVNHSFADSLGGVAAEVVLMPVAVRDRTIAIVFGDNAGKALPDASLHAVCHEAGLAYERLILNRKPQPQAR